MFNLSASQRIYLSRIWPNGKRGLSSVIQERPVFQHCLLSYLAIAALCCVTSGYPKLVFGASFDCAKTRSQVERLVCNSPKLSELDSKLGQDYQAVLHKANDEQKQRVIAEQKHWLEHTRNVCDTETCLKHAYWSRQAALEAWFEPHSPLYKHESDKAEAIKKVLATSPLYYRAGTVKEINQFCTRMFDDLKEMNGIRFIDPVVQTQSYEDPALDPWKKNCRSAPPLNFSAGCVGNVPNHADDMLDLCMVSYGLPPFKVFELPPSGTSKDKRYIFYSDDGYGPMNRSYGPNVGGGFSGFREINPRSCLAVFKGAFSQADPHDHNGTNYNSIIEYKNRYYFLILNQYIGSYKFDVDSVDDQKLACRWASVKPK